MERLTIWSAVVFLVVFLADMLALLCIRRPGKSRPCLACGHAEAGPAGMLLCRRATQTLIEWDPVTGSSAKTQRRVPCDSERRGGLINAWSISLALRRKPACSRYGLAFKRKRKTP